MSGHCNKQSWYMLTTFQMFRWSSPVLNPEPASDFIQLKEWGTMILHDSVSSMFQLPYLHIILSVI